ncbi:MAG: RND transporter [Bacteroidia bacterium]|jgi:HlyD family secretion protein|nr:MAG: RND transporter [Bacteroidia bacterium]
MKKKNYFKKYGILLAIIVIMIIVTKWLGFWGKEKWITVETAKSVRRTLLSKVSESGTIQPVTELSVAPDVSGEIIQITVKEGDFVKKGQLLFVIKPDNYQALLEQAQASLNAAKSDYENALSNVAQAETNLMQDSVDYYRVTGLWEKKVVSQTEYEAAKLKYQISKSRLDANKKLAQAAFYRVESANASLKQAKENLQRTSVYSTMDGFVTKLPVTKGQRVVGTGQMQGTEVMKIADLSQMEVKVEINENDIVNISIGDSALIEVDAFPEKKFKGFVKDIAYSASQNAIGTTDQITNFTVKVFIDPASYQNDRDLKHLIPGPGQSPFRPGMSAYVSIYTDKKENVVAVPIQAVTIDLNQKKENAKAQEILYRYVNNQVLKTNVKTGISDDEFIEIVTGLKENEDIVVGPYIVVSKQLKDSMKVIAKPAEMIKSQENKPKTRDIEE